MKGTTTAAAVFVAVVVVRLQMMRWCLCSDDCDSLMLIVEQERLGGLDRKSAFQPNLPLFGGRGAVQNDVLRGITHKHCFHMCENCVRVCVKKL